MNTNSTTSQPGDISASTLNLTSPIESSLICCLCPPSDTPPLILTWAPFYFSWPCFTRFTWTASSSIWLGKSPSISFTIHSRMRPLFDEYRLENVRRRRWCARWSGAATRRRDDDGGPVIAKLAKCQCTERPLLLRWMNKWMNGVRWKKIQSVNFFDGPRSDFWQ